MNAVFTNVSSHVTHACIHSYPRVAWAVYVTWPLPEEVCGSVCSTVHSKATYATYSDRLSAERGCRTAIGNQFCPYVALLSTEV